LHGRCRYVGLVSAACFAELGWTVKCNDKDVGHIARLEIGEAAILEPGLQDLLQLSCAPHTVLSRLFLRLILRRVRDGSTSKGTHHRYAR
jgi:UDP-glucose/GDP-mannose dehydrogenase family, NAD binding domain